MKDAGREARQIEIEAAAYDVLAERGYSGTSMLNVARRAKASNETLYRWYGDKNGLFSAMVRRNADASAKLLAQAIEQPGSTLTTLQDFAPLLLSMLLGERAVMLNRAAAGDATQTLGRIIAMEGRERVMPLLTALLSRAMSEGVLARRDSAEAAELFVTLLVGDLQIRRVIGAMSEPSSDQIASRSQRALRSFLSLCPPGGDVAPELPDRAG